MAEDFAHQLGLPRRPQINLTNGNGTLNAFAAQTSAGFHPPRMRHGPGHHLRLEEAAPAHTPPG
jgi:hypothetical protein